MTTQVEQISLTLGTLKRLAQELDHELDKVNIAGLRICRDGKIISVHTCEGLAAQFDVDILTAKQPMVETPNRASVKANKWARRTNITHRIKSFLTKLKTHR